MPLIKMAAFDVSNQIMTAFAGERKTAVIGNWVRARGKGVIDGFDYGTSGEIEKLQTDSIKTVLDNGFIPIFPCIGWSIAGKPYNISSIELSQQIAINLNADKLFFLVPNAEISSENFLIPKEIGLSQEGNIPALNLEEVELFLKTNEPSINSTENNENSTERLVNLDKNVSPETNKMYLKEKIFTLLKKAEKACTQGVDRVHILNGSIDGVVPCEIFSDLGSGTMVYSNNYGKIREMTREDIPAVLNVMQPFIESGILLPRTKESLSAQFNNFIVYELDRNKDIIEFVSIPTIGKLICTNYGFLDFSGKLYSNVPDTQLSFPNNLFFDCISYDLAIRFLCKMNADSSGVENLNRNAWNQLTASIDQNADFQVVKKVRR